MDDPDLQEAINDILSSPVLERKPIPRVSPQPDASTPQVAPIDEGDENLPSSSAIEALAVDFGDADSPGDAPVSDVVKVPSAGSESDSRDDAEPTANPSKVRNGQGDRSHGKSSSQANVDTDSITSSQSEKNKETSLAQADDDFDSIKSESSNIKPEAATGDIPMDRETTWEDRRGERKKREEKWPKTKIVSRSKSLDCPSYPAARSHQNETETKSLKDWPSKFYDCLENIEDDPKESNDSGLESDSGENPNPNPIKSNGKNIPSADEVGNDSLPSSNEVAIAIPEEMEVDNSATEVACVGERQILVYFSGLYYSGVTLVHPFKLNNLRNWKSYIQMALFILVGAISIWQGIFYLRKKYLFGEKKYGDVSRHLVMFYWLNHLLMRAYHIILPIIKFYYIVKIFNLLKAWRTHANGNVNNLPLSPFQRLATYLPHICFISSIAASILLPILEAAQAFGWDSKEVILYHSGNAAISVLVWNPQTADNQTEVIVTDYATDLNATTATMGAGHLFMMIVGYVHVHFIRDLSLILASTMLSMIISFYLLLKLAPPKTADLGVQIAYCQMLWEKWEILTQLTEEADNAFGIQFSLQDADNMLFTVYFTRGVILGEHEWPSMVVQLFNILKMFSSYFIAASYADVNTQFERFVLEASDGDDTFFKEGDKFLSKVVVIAKIKSRPVGMGRGFFRVNKGFIGKFLGIVASFFMFLANPRIATSSS